MHFHKDGAGDAEFNKVWSECEAKAGQAGYVGGGWIGASKRKGYMERCMAGEGWARLD